MAFLFIGLGLNFALIYIYAPVDNKNKPFSETERKRFRFRSLLANCVMTATAIFIWFINARSGIYAVCIMMGILTAGLSVAIGSVQHSVDKSRG